MRGDSLKVLVLADSRSFHTERYLAELKRQGCEPVLASLESGDTEHHLLKRKGPIRALHYSMAVWEVQNLIASFDPDVVNPHFASGYGHLAALAVRDSGRPVLLHCWGSDILIAPHKSFLHRRKTRIALERADCVVGDSNYLLDEATRIGRLKARRTITWGLERGSLRPLGEQKNFSRPLRILVPRPHQSIYNNLFVLRALCDLVIDDRIELTFPDFGNDLERFKAEAAATTGDRVKFYPKRSRSDYLEFAAAQDIFLSAALSDSSPASLLEAMGLGLIPVVGDIPGVREWVTPDSGYLFDLERESSLSEIVRHLTEAEDDHSLMRQHNRERIENEAIFEDNIVETIALMRELATGGEA